MRTLILVAALCAAPAFAQAAVQPQPLAQEIGPTLVDLALAGIIALGALAGRLAHIATKTGKLNSALVVATEYINGAVKGLLEQLAPDIKADLANDGVIDANERGHLLDKAFLLVKADLPLPVQKILATSFGEGLMTMLEGKIASALDAHLTATAQAPTSAPAPTAPTPAVSA